MCLLTFIPDYVSPDMEKFSIAAKSNPDGFGFAIHTGKTIIRRHSMDFDKLADQFLSMRSQHQGPATFHFRWATHGSETLDNCHPFLLGGDRNSVMAHNGILPVAIDKGDKRSDTRVFAEDYMPNIGGIVALDDADYWKKLEAWAAGSKLVFLTTNPDAQQDWYILNEADGHWADDMWWSNSSYKPTVYTYGSYGSYGGWNNYGYAEYSTMDGGWDMTSVRVPSDDYEYDDEEQMDWDVIEQQFDVFTTRIDNNTDLIECYHCGHDYKVPADTLNTHCDECSCCLFCGAYACRCWVKLESSVDIDAWNWEVVQGASDALRTAEQQKEDLFKKVEQIDLMMKNK